MLLFSTDKNSLSSYGFEGWSLIGICLFIHKNIHYLLEIILSAITIIVPILMTTIISAIEALSDEDRVLDYGGLGNFSLSGFEMVPSIYSPHNLVYSVTWQLELLIIMLWNDIKQCLISIVLTFDNHPDNFDFFILNLPPCFLVAKYPLFLKSIYNRRRIVLQVLTRYVSTYIITYYLPSGYFNLFFPPHHWTHFAKLP